MVNSGPTNRTSIVLIDGHHVLRVDLGGRCREHANDGDGYPPDDVPERNRQEDIQNGVAGHTRSMIRALAIPPPSHMVCSP